MNLYKFAGTLKSIKVSNDGSKCFMLLCFVPDVEFSVSHKNGDTTQKVVVFHPTGKWENGLSYCYDDYVVLKTECRDLYGMALGTHCELEVAEVSDESLFTGWLIDWRSFMASQLSAAGIDSLCFRLAS